MLISSTSRKSSFTTSPSHSSLRRIVHTTKLNREAAPPVMGGSAAWLASRRPVGSWQGQRQNPMGRRLSLGNRSPWSAPHHTGKHEAVLSYEFRVLSCPGRTADGSRGAATQDSALPLRPSSFQIPNPTSPDLPNNPELRTRNSSDAIPHSKFIIRETGRFPL